MAIDIDRLWDYDQPQQSEQRFRTALQSLTDPASDDALSLRTQIARTYSLTRRYAEAHAELDAIGPALAKAGAEPKVRALLERGRTLRSAGDPTTSRPLFEAAFRQADAAGLVVLAADALHMLPLVAPDAATGADDTRRLLDYVRGREGRAMRAWEAVALNNLGVALNDQGRTAEALPLFEQGLALRERIGPPAAVRVARWMIANAQRRLGRHDEALALQLQLERECDEAGAPDPYVYEELALLYDARGDAARAAHYRARLAAVGGTGG